jgi:hypothetical protein
MFQKETLTAGLLPKGAVLDSLKALATLRRFVRVVQHEQRQIMRELWLLQ